MEGTAAERVYSGQQTLLPNSKRNGTQGTDNKSVQRAERA